MTTNFWEYRIGVKKHKYNSINEDGVNEPFEDLEYGLVECYYDDECNIKFTTERFIEPSGETKEELIENLEMMLKDAKKDAPVLDLEKLWKELEMKEMENKL